MNIILHGNDMGIIDYWKKSIKDECIIIDDIDELLLVENSLIITNFSTCTPECDITIKSLLDRNNKILVLDHEPTLANAKNILKFGASGYGNVIMREHFLNAAINTIKDGMVWLYPSLTSMLINDIDKLSTKKDKLYLLDVLTDRQKEVSILVADGLTYKLIAEKLDITPRTVKSHAENSYKKLGVKDRLGLALLIK